MFQDQLDTFQELIELKLTSEREKLALLESQGWGDEVSPLVRALDRKIATLASLASSLNATRLIYGC